LAADPAAADGLGRRAAAWGQRHSLDELEAAIAGLLTEWWGVPVRPTTPRTSVLHVTDTLDAGGAERMALNLVNGLDPARYRPALCTTRHPGALAAEARPDIAQLSLGRRSRRDDPVAVLRLARHLRRERVDLVHAHGTSLFISAAACLLRPATRLVWHDHLGAAPDSRVPRRWLYRLAVRRVDRVITVSRALAEWDHAELGVPDDDIETLPNFVVTPTVVAEPTGLPGHDGRRVACVANLRPQKDHALLVDAIDLVRRTVPDVQALLLGAPVDTSVARAVEARIAERGLGEHVHLLGARSDVAAVLAHATIGVLSSRSEGFPLALLEYGDAGLAVVATRVGECPEILDEGAAGRLVPPGDAEALARALVELLTDPAEAARLGARLRERVEHRYGPSAVVARVEELYDDLTGVAGAPVGGS
ncbi:MAG: glycosyltransferase, partial [Acidimicrobiales bacterium]|nr:glycosyltransferase [Acidimicrobiales bacterium]